MWTAGTVVQKHQLASRTAPKKMMKTREQAIDRNGLPLAPGLLVRLPDGAVQPEARVVRIIGDYDVVTVVIEDRTGKVERMYACTEIEVLATTRVRPQVGRNVA